MSGWIKCSYRMPPSRELVVMLLTDGLVSTGRYYSNYSRFAWGYALPFTLRTVECEVTHWMPLPAPPEAE